MTPPHVPPARPATKGRHMNSAARIQSIAESGVFLLKQAAKAGGDANDSHWRLREAMNCLLAAKWLSEGKAVCPGCNSRGQRTANPAVLVCDGCGGLVTSRSIS